MEKEKKKKKKIVVGVRAFPSRSNKHDPRSIYNGWGGKLQWSSRPSECGLLYS